VIARRPADAAVVICSDHGNVEDLSTRGHTLNQVPVLAFGAPELKLETVADVGTEVMRVIG
jgi:2,3-bisphosphoglycerate-independent phosphoglycerate mutase